MAIDLDSFVCIEGAEARFFSHLFNPIIHAHVNGDARVSRAPNHIILSVRLLDLLWDPAEIEVCRWLSNQLSLLSLRSIARSGI